MRHSLQIQFLLNKVGSSSGLARRLIGYINDTHVTTGKLIPLIKKEGIGAFKLEVIPLTESYAEKQEICLEQYFLLHSEFNLNTLRVVSDISGVRAKKLYMYTKDLSKLIYAADIQEDFIFKLGVHHSTFSHCLKTGAIYLNKYIFTNKPPLFPSFPLSLFPSFPLSLFPSFPLSLFPSFPPLRHIQIQIYIRELYFLTYQIFDIKYLICKKSKSLIYICICICLEGGVREYG